MTALRLKGLHNSWTFFPLQVTQAPPNTNLIAATSAFISRSLPNVNAPVNDTNNAKIIDNKVIFVACLYSNLSISSSFSVYSTLNFYFVLLLLFTTPSVGLELFRFVEKNLNRNRSQSIHEKASTRQHEEDVVDSCYHAINVQGISDDMRADKRKAAEEFSLTLSRDTSRHNCADFSIFDSPNTLCTYIRFLRPASHVRESTENRFRLASFLAGGRPKRTEKDRAFFRSRARL